MGKDDIDGDFTVIHQREEPKSYRDEVLDDIYRRSIILPGFFVFWYAGVFVWKMIVHYVFIAGWKAARRRLRSPGTGLRAAPSSVVKSARYRSPRP